MKAKNGTILAVLALICSSSVLPASAALSPAELATLGTTLTLMGAEKAGNAEGTIPGWDGGFVKPVSGYATGNAYPVPFAGDKPLLTITGASAEKHRDNLTPGQMAMLKLYSSYKMAVFPTRRTASFPLGHYKETLECAAKSKLSEGGNGVIGCTGGVPFPIPKNGNEAIWNTILRYHGDTFASNLAQAAVTRNGDYVIVKFEYELDYSYGNLSKTPAQREPNRILNFLQIVNSPPRLAGQILLVYETLDQTTEPRLAWSYNPGQRRVRLAPQVAYDNPGTGADGLRTTDDFGMFNGATDRYDWKLMDKREIYVPYNSYTLVDPAIKYADILKPLHINQDLARYELHRVWVVDATLKPGFRHIYSRRTFYIDEDSWAVLAVDKYDARGDLWRFAEQHNQNRINIPMWSSVLEIHYDLQSGRYIAGGLRNEEFRVFDPIKRTPADYTPAALRGIGTR